MTSERPPSPVSASAGAWCAAVVAAVAFARLLSLLDDEVSGEHVVWLATCVVAAVASGALGVVSRLGGTGD